MEFPQWNLRLELTAHLLPRNHLLVTGQRRKVRLSWEHNEVSLDRLCLRLDLVLLRLSVAWRKLRELFASAAVPQRLRLPTKSSETWCAPRVPKEQLDTRGALLRVRYTFQATENGSTLAPPTRMQIRFV